MLTVGDENVQKENCRVIAPEAGKEKAVGG